LQHNNRRTPVIYLTLLANSYYAPALGVRDFCYIATKNDKFI
jgi:hypothetical protein